MSTGRREAPRSELGRQVTVDLEADANLYEYWGIPHHGGSPWIGQRDALRGASMATVEHCAASGARRENP
jgi:hypothetical protein